MPFNQLFLASILKRFIKREIINPVLFFVYLFTFFFIQSYQNSHPLIIRIIPSNEF
jgi:hypothetical protein